MKERPKIECRALYCIARIEGRQMVRVRQFPDPLYVVLCHPFSPTARRVGRQLRLRRQ
jgi:hypothetical protein